MFDWGRWKTVAFEIYTRDHCMMYYVGRLYAGVQKGRKTMKAIITRNFGVRSVSCLYFINTMVLYFRESLGKG